MGHYVYSIDNGEFIKVGCTTNISNRIEQLSHFNPYPLITMHCVEYKTKGGALTVERCIHERLKILGYHHKYEWFFGTEETKEELELYFSELTPEYVEKKENESHGLFYLYKKAMSLGVRVDHIKEKLIAHSKYNACEDIKRRGYTAMGFFFVESGACDLILETIQEREKA